MFDFKKDVVYYFDEMIGTYHYANNHPMKPLRVAMTDELVKVYKIDQNVQVIVFHYLSRINVMPNNSKLLLKTKPLPLFTPTNTLMSSKTLLPKTDPTLKINSTDLISKKIALSCKDFMIMS